MSTPSKASVVRFESPKRSSIDHQLVVGVPGPDYAYMSISHLALIPTLDQPYLGKSIIWLKNTEKISVTLLETEKDVQDQLRVYGVDLDYPFFKLMKVEVTVSNIDFDIPSTSIRALRSRNSDLCAQLEKIKNSTSSNGNFRVVLTAAFQSREQLQEYQNLRDRLQKAKNRDVAEAGPIRSWFVDENGGRRYTLFPSQVPDNDDLRTLGTGLRVARYVDEDQQLVHQMAGSAFDEKLQKDAQSTLPMDAVLLPFRYAQGRQFLMLLRTSENNPYLPRKGESCGVTFPSVQVASVDKKLPVDDQGSMKHLILGLVREISDDQTDDNAAATAAAIAEACSPHLMGGLSQEDAAHMLRQPGDNFDDNNESTWEKRIFNILDGKKHLFQKLAPEPSLEPGQVEFSAYRQDTSNHHMGHLFQMFIVRVPKMPLQEGDPNTERELVNLELPFTIPKEGELIKEFVQRLMEAQPPLESTTELDFEMDTQVNAGNCWGETETQTNAGAGWDETDTQTNTGDASAGQTDTGDNSEDGSTNTEDASGAVTFIQVILHGRYSPKAIKAESLAMNALRFPQCKPSEIVMTEAEMKLSQDQYKYQLRFDPTGIEVINLHERLPALARVRATNTDTSLSDEAPDAPLFCDKLYKRLDKSKRTVYKKLAHMPAGLAFINGVAGCGKSTLFQTIIILLFYAACGASSTEKTASPGPHKVLYLVNSNAAVDNFAEEVMDTLASLGLEKTFPILHLYGIDSEVSSYIKKTSKRQDEDFIDLNAAKKFCDNFQGDDFLAALQLVKLEADIQTAKAEDLESKKRNRCISLESAAAKYFMANKDLFPALSSAIDGLEKNGKLGEDVQLKALVKHLYAEFLKQFNGLICSTPVGCSNQAIHQSYKPDLVLVDEAGRLRELSFMIPIAWYHAPTIVVGDYLQFEPHLTLEHGQEMDKLSTNPFWPAITNSTLCRAVHAGATIGMLCVNHRQHGDLIKLPSNLFYNGQMESSLYGTEIWSDATNAWHAYLLKLHPGLSKRKYMTLRLLVEFTGAQIQKAGTSTYNPTHVHWVMGRLPEILGNPALTDFRGTQAVRVLIIALYRAQVHEYQLALKKATDNKDLTKEQAKRVKISTLDGSQGHERDIAIIDFTQTSHPGFCGDPRRLLVALTRSKVGEILVMNRGMFSSGFDRPTSKAKDRAHMLHRVYDKVREKGAVLRIVSCPRCETSGHSLEDCKTTLSTPGETHQSCKRNDHKAGECLERFCLNCRRTGHTANECGESFICSKCFKSGHFSWACENPKKCHLCHGDFKGHNAESCEKGQERLAMESKQCRKCNGYGHLAKDCTEGKAKVFTGTCHRCGEEGHTRLMCPSGPKCVCGEFHKRYDCPHLCTACNRVHIEKPCPKPAEVCGRCQNPGHETSKCPEKTQCRKCAGFGHHASDCSVQKSNRKTRAGFEAKVSLKHLHRQKDIARDILAGDETHTDAPSVTESPQLADDASANETHQVTDDAWDVDF